MELAAIETDKLKNRKLETEKFHKVPVVECVHCCKINHHHSACF